MNHKKLYRLYREERISVTRFARSIPIMVTSDMDALSFYDGFNKHHLGTLRCRREGASIPSTKPLQSATAIRFAMAAAPEIPSATAPSANRNSTFSVN